MACSARHAARPSSQRNSVSLLPLLGITRHRWDNHKRSKKHLAAVEALRETLTEEEQQLAGSDAASASGDTASQSGSEPAELSDIDQPHRSAEHDELQTTVDSNTAQCSDNDEGTGAYTEPAETLADLITSTHVSDEDADESTPASSAATARVPAGKTAGKAASKAAPNPASVDAEAAPAEGDSDEEYVKLLTGIVSDLRSILVAMMGRLGRAGGKAAPGPAPLDEDSDAPPRDVRRKKGRRKARNPYDCDDEPSPAAPPTAVSTPAVAAEARSESLPKGPEAAAETAPEPSPSIPAKGSKVST